MALGRFATVSGLVLAVLVCSHPLHEPVSAETGFVNMPFRVDGMDRTAALWIPAEYDSSEKWPLIVYLHGGGGNGDNNGDAVEDLLNRGGLSAAIRRNPERFPALALFPRCPTGKIWSPIPANPVQSAWRLRRHGTDPVPDAEDHITAAIDAVIARFAVAEDRIVLTGHSMGGEGSIRYAALHADRVAAVAPSAGSAVLVLEDAPVLAGIGVWLFQGENDEISTAPLARRMIEAIQRAGGRPRYTEFDEVGHGTARLVYEDPAVIKWMLSQRRADK